MSDEEPVYTEEDLQELWEEARQNSMNIDQAWVEYRVTDISIDDLFEKYGLNKDNETEHK